MATLAANREDELLSVFRRLDERDQIALVELARSWMDLTSKKGG